MSPEREKLFELEKTNQYIFHGSGNRLEYLEPRQAYNYIDKVGHEDGEPAVFASSLVDYAIFMAIINKRNCPLGYHSSAGFTQDTHTLSLRSDKKGWEQLKEDAVGYVYVFNHKNFSERDPPGIEYVSYAKVIPAQIIEVKKLDLPDYIEIFEA